MSKAAKKSAVKLVESEPTTETKAVARRGAPSILLSRDVTIQSGVPIPAPMRGAPLYPWDKMEVQDSFMIPLAEGDNTKALQSRLKSAAANWGRKNNASFTARPVTEDGVDGVRIWRVR